MLAFYRRTRIVPAEDVPNRRPCRNCDSRVDIRCSCVEVCFGLLCLDIMLTRSDKATSCASRPCHREWCSTVQSQSTVLYLPLQTVNIFNSSSRLASNTFLYLLEAQVNTQEYGRRPYGVGFLVIGGDKTGPHLYEFSPSGNSYEYYAMSIGARSQSAKTYLEKHYESFMDCTFCFRQNT